MKIITQDNVKKVLPTPSDCVNWVDSALRLKKNVMLPPKTSIHLANMGFVNTMPVLIHELGVFGVKIVTRVIGRIPAIQAEIFVYNLRTGQLEAIMDGTLITKWRTGAVAAHSYKLFCSTTKPVVALMGLGETAHATFSCLIDIWANGSSPRCVKLLRYKDQAEKFIQTYKGYGIEFEIVDSYPDLMLDADVVFSCVTAFERPVMEEKWFKRGSTVIPVHTRGFQDCNTSFDKVFCDDIGHVSGFGNFKHMKSVCEVSDVICGCNKGRESATERILVYNVGIGLHDIYFAKQVLNLLKERGL